ncbi:MAG: pitrilysin family protein [Asticcacaulis sp.]
MSTLAMTTALAPVHAMAAPVAVKAAPVSELVKAVNIPYSTFTLKNGLRVIVHTDRKAPVVAVSVWYNVGSKHEPKGKTGFAHLFEHLMFNGSENASGDFFEPLQQVGATDYNGTTWFDRTNYFETVPTPALDVALFLESDRMGHLLGAVTQEKLDNQRGVVQNEKRQGDNQPYGLVEYAQLEGLLPEGHPYHHSTIGSMADLDSASLEDVKNWFRASYGPNNAVLVLAGDIDEATARAKVEKWFGDIPTGATVAPVKVDIPTLSARKDMVMKDRVAQTRLYRYWAVPGLDSADRIPLDIAAGVLGGLSSSRLDNILVRDEQLAVRVSAELQTFAQLSFFEISVDVKPGVDADVVAKRLDAIVADYIAKGPTADEVARVATRHISSTINGLESVGGFGGKATQLAEGALYLNDPDAYKKELNAFATATPAQVTKVMGKWLTRPVFALSVVPGARDAYKEAGGKDGKRDGVTSGPALYLDAAEAEAVAGGAPLTAVDRSHLPPVGDIKNIDFPAVETTTLSNGVKVYFARRTAVPVVRLSLSFNAGHASDSKGRLGVHSLMLAAMDEGTKTLSDVQIAEAQERLGASISLSGTMDRTVVGLSALTANLDPSLDLLADIVKNPAFDEKAVTRVRNQRLAAIAQELTQPQAIASRTLAAAMFGADHPYGRPSSGNGTADVVSALTPAELSAFHDAWIRPDKLEIFVVGDTTLADIKAKLETRFGQWKAPAIAAGQKSFGAAIPTATPRIILVNRPQSPQSVIYAGEVLKVRGTDDLLTFTQANDVLGGSFLSRINMDLRETKGWSYGVRSMISRYENQVPFMVVAPVQADRTGDSITALRTQITDFLGAKGVTPEELKLTINGSVRELAGSFETSGAVLGQMRGDALYKRSFDYIETVAGKLEGLDAKALDTSARDLIQPDKLVWVVVGDKEKVLPQLEGLGLPVEVVDAPK